MEIEGAEFFEFAFGKMFRHFGVAEQLFEEIGVVAPACFASQVCMALRWTSS